MCRIRVNILYIHWFVILLFCTELKAGNNTETSCNRYVSSAQDPTPAQITGGATPVVVTSIDWQRPAIAISKAVFSGRMYKNQKVNITEHTVLQVMKGMGFILFL
ncbi:MAG: hypothetical protein Q7U47_11555 [Paludibacter sp.]|nr:hypothetical protein [Paludibacter sp.]